MNLKLSLVTALIFTLFTSIDFITPCYAVDNATTKTFIVPAPFKVKQPTEKAPNEMVKVIAIDMDADGDITTDSILWGRDAILLLKLDEKSITENQTSSPLAKFTSWELLNLMDDNRDGDIDELDVAYPHLRLLQFFRGGKRFVITPLDIQGMRAIFLSKERMLSSPVTPSPEFADVANHAVMADSSRRKVQLTEIKKKHLEKVGY